MSLAYRYTALKAALAGLFAAITLNVASVTSLAAEIPLFPLEGVVEPAWYRAHRLHAHTRLMPIVGARQAARHAGVSREQAAKRMDDILAEIEDPWVEAYYNAAALVSGLGGSVLTRHVVTKDEAPPWQATGDDQRSDLVANMLSEAAQADVRLIAYYWHATDRAAAEQHPEWVCRNGKGEGKIARHPNRGAFMDFVSRYQDVVAERIREVHAMGADGIYFDGRQLPRLGCFGSEIERRFVASPEGTPYADVDDVIGSPDYRWAFQIFQAEQVAQAFARWTGEVRDDPEFAFLATVGALPTLVNPQVAVDHARTAIPKTEFTAASRPGMQRRLFERAPALRRLRPSDSTRDALGWNFLRTISGASPHVWIHDIWSYDALLLAVGAVVTHGGIANIDLAEDVMPVGAHAPNEPSRVIFERVFALASTLDPLFANAKPDTFAAIHFSQALRNEAGNSRAAWLDVAGPVSFAYHTLLHARVPVAVIDDRLLAEGDLSAYRYVVSSTAEQLSDEQRANLERAGAALVAVPNLRKMTEPYARYEEALQATINAAAALPVRVTADDGAHAVTWHDEQTNRLIVSVVAPFADDVHLQGNPAPTDVPRVGRVVVSLADAREGRCARNALTGAVLPIEDGKITISAPALWHLIVIEGCA